MNRPSIRIAVLFSLLVFVILTTTMFLTIFFARLLEQSNILASRPQEVSIVVFALGSSIVGTMIAVLLTKRPINKMVEISEATKEITRGNFDVKLREDISVTEFQEVARNFNLMTKELARTEMLRNDFIANVSHEFKTPLSAIEGYAALLQKRDLSEEKRLEYTARIMYSTKRLSALTGNILLLSKLENQELGVRRERYCLDEQLRESILLLEDQWSAKRLELEIDLDPADYRGNRELLAQVWQNILGNAIKFSPAGGQIRVLLNNERDAVQVSIADSGIGMSEEVRQRVFEKFYQGDASHSDNGSGLGLALAKRIVDLHGGVIQVSSREGEGSAFVVTLPH